MVGKKGEESKNPKSRDRNAKEEGETVPDVATGAEDPLDSRDEIAGAWKSLASLEMKDSDVGREAPE